MVAIKSEVTICSAEVAPAVPKWPYVESAATSSLTAALRSCRSLRTSSSFCPTARYCFVPRRLYLIRFYRTTNAIRLWQDKKRTLEISDGLRCTCPDRQCRLVTAGMWPCYTLDVLGTRCCYQLIIPPTDGLGMPRGTCRHIVATLTNRLHVNRKQMYLALFNNHMTTPHYRQKLSAYVLPAFHLV